MPACWFCGEMVEQLQVCEKCRQEFCDLHSDPANHDCPGVPVTNPYDIPQTAPPVDSFVTSTSPTGNFVTPAPPDGEVVHPASIKISFPNTGKKGPTIVTSGWMPLCSIQTQDGLQYSHMAHAILSQPPLWAPLGFRMENLSIKAKQYSYNFTAVSGDKLTIMVEFNPFPGGCEIRWCLITALIVGPPPGITVTNDQLIRMLKGSIETPLIQTLERLAVDIENAGSAQALREQWAQRDHANQY